MTDCELLEAAAKAAGFSLIFSSEEGRSHRRSDNWVAWNPLTDDGDALRLAVKLRIALMWGTNHDVVRVDRTEGFPLPIYEIVIDGDQYAATRRAIVRAAAAMATEEQR